MCFQKLFKLTLNHIITLYIYTFYLFVYFILKYLNLQWILQVNKKELEKRIILSKTSVKKQEEIFTSNLSSYDKVFTVNGRKCENNQFEIGDEEGCARYETHP